MRRFIVPPEQMNVQTITIEGDLFRHMSRVLRLQQGDSILLCDGSGRERTGCITGISRSSLSVELSEILTTLAPATSLTLTLIQGLPKSDRFELIIQKATELGVSAVVAFHASRSVVRVSPGLHTEKIARWQRIATEAARQSERSSVPLITLEENLEAALHTADQSVKLMLLEREKNRPLREILTDMQLPGSAAVLVGPEGGFSPEESRMATESGFLQVSLGNRILRTETASISILSILQYQWGDLG